MLNVKEFITLEENGPIQSKGLLGISGIESGNFPASMFFNFDTGKIEITRAEEFDTKEMLTSKSDSRRYENQRKYVSILPSIQPNTDSKSRTKPVVELPVEQKQDRRDHGPNQLRLTRKVNKDQPKRKMKFPKRMLRQK
jgi:hypothetical protein